MLYSVVELVVQGVPGCSASDRCIATAPKHGTWKLSKRHVALKRKDT